MMNTRVGKTLWGSLEYVQAELVNLNDAIGGSSETEIRTFTRP